MKRITLGNTGLTVNRLGFGGIAIQRVSEQQAIETVIHAVESGTDFIDTSRIYDTSEERIGKALQQVDRRRVVLASKSKDRTADGLRRDLDISLATLQTERIELYQCHFVKPQEYETIIAPGGALEGLQKAKQEGQIGHIGISSHSLDLLERIVSDGLFETIMVCFNFLENKAAEKVIPAALAKGIGVIAMKPMAGGVIEEADLALEFALSVEDVLVLCGVESKALFDQNWRVFHSRSEWNDPKRKAVAEAASRYDREFCRRCDYCQPCSEEINIQMMLGIRSQVKRMGPGILQKEPSMSIIEQARQCSECGECMTRCPYELEIPMLIRKNLEWIDDLLQTL